MTAKDWTLLVLASANGAPFTPVQLQKTLFLLGKRLPSETEHNFYSFRPYHYGPFDSSVYRDAEILTLEGLGYTQAGRMKSYGATASGIARAQQLATEAPTAGAFVPQLVTWVRQQSFQTLVRAVYSEFPDMKSQSIFRE